VGDAFVRLDTYLVEAGLAPSRTKAQNYIKEGHVLVDKEVVTKSSFDVDDANHVELTLFKDYVSRAAWKLLHFLEETGLDVSGKKALDIGSSTGGFTEVMLERGVKSVACVDVGSDQLHEKLKNDERVSVHEKTDIRKFSHEPFELVVSDVSFISLLHILESVDRLAKKDIVLLFKPQFEVGVGVKRDKKGVVKDDKAIQKAMMKFEDACQLKGWHLVQKSPSKITGKDGNLEYCYHYTKS